MARPAAAEMFRAADLPKIAGGKGSYVTDADGKQYIDGSGGPAVFCIGHGNEEVNAAIAATATASPAIRWRRCRRSWRARRAAA